MQHMFSYGLFLTLSVLITLSCCLSYPCNTTNQILICSVSNPTSVVDTTTYNLSPSNSIKITYKGNVGLSLIAPSTNPIVIEPLDTNDNYSLQIISINSNAASIRMNVRLSSVQVLLPLFVDSSNITASASTFIIVVTQSIVDARNFKVFGSSSSSSMNIFSYQLIFNTSSPNSGTLYLPSLTNQLINVSSISVSGNNHTLIVDRTSLSTFNLTRTLSLKFLRLYDPILDNFPSLTEYSIQGCQYNKSANFLLSSQTYNISVNMQNNNIIDGTLPNDDNAFSKLATIIGLTFIESQLNSSCLRAVRNPTRPRTMLLDLKSYVSTDFDYWMTDRPVVSDLTIRSISNLSVLPSKFFNALDAINQVKLQGTYQLQKQHICIFFGIGIQVNRGSQIITLENGVQSINNNLCADTYIKAINYKTMQDVYCPPTNSMSDCERWADQAENCKLVAFENQCSGSTIVKTNIFYYNKSYLYNFFRNDLWKNSSNDSTEPSTGQSGSISIGAIIGAICGLIIAIIVLATTIFCIYRYRGSAFNKNVLSIPENEYKSSPNDFTNVSIATSKSSQSSHRPLAKSFFHPIKPNEQIAPPLYTAPSEAAASTSVYNLQKARAARRDSALTDATHVYETIDS